MYVQIANLYNKNHGLAGDQLIASQRWCQKKWEHLLSPIESCDQVIVRLVTAFLLIIPTASACVIGIVGVVCKITSFTKSTYNSHARIEDYLAIVGNEPFAIRGVGRDAALLLQRHLDETMVPLIEQILAEVFGQWLPIVKFEVDARESDQQVLISCSVPTSEDINSSHFSSTWHVNGEGCVVFELSKRGVLAGIFPGVDCIK